MALHYEKAKFERSYGTTAQLPRPEKPEVSFAGRSNVGKSSLVNKLFNRKALAKVSGTPGKTSNINFFEADGVYFVDLPGYGYAKKSQSERQRWADMIFGYYNQERSFNLVIVLVDIRLEMQKLDKRESQLHDAMAAAAGEALDTEKLADLDRELKDVVAEKEQLEERWMGIGEQLEG